MVNSFMGVSVRNFDPGMPMNVTTMVPWTRLDYLPKSQIYFYVHRDQTSDKINLVIPNDGIPYIQDGSNFAEVCIRQSNYTYIHTHTYTYNIHTYMHT